ncbi:hypothetical protein [Glutamicibacter nicotianae]|uniref:hypothetical protein n=1 Tax=Glutamicibacter nicotianae TaxID=37929 RepID=UPI00255710DC|nr:hypothetical protein [Glutamicibacter nicotianae]WIV42597.1 hypothetical protein QQS42_09655 [Glutamicibacter nicotianae]
MAGIRMKLRSIAAPILDTFATGGALIGAPTMFGGKTWTKVGTETTVTTKAGGEVKATSGSGNVPITIPTGSANFEFAFTLTAVRTPSSIAAAVFRVSDSTNHYTLLLRTDTNVPQYAVASRSSNVLTMLLETGVAPSAGDTVRVTIQNHVLRLYVNGVQLGGAIALGAYGQYQNAGLLFNGLDPDTGFGDFAIYPA